MRAAWIFVVVAACSASEAVPDAAGCPGNICPVCSGPYQAYWCLNGRAGGIDGWSRTTSATAACPSPDQTWSATCAQGCTAEGWSYANGIGGIVSHPAVLCAETPAKQLGDSCASDGLCLPTRADVAADGTVTQTYLICDASTQTCLETPAPVIDGYLAPCDARTVAAYGKPGATGYAELSTPGRFCLIAWDATTGTAANGETASCLGDWECPQGALCDGGITSFDHLHLGVCKPGPRGVLTPAMLTP